MQEILIKIKSAISGDVFVVLIIVLVGLSAFGLGRLSALETGRLQVRVLEPGQQAAVVNVLADGEKMKEVSRVGEIANLGGQYVASKKGKRYFFPWCGGAARISDTNKVWFNTKEEAQQAGYTPAGNCKGL